MNIVKCKQSGTFSLEYLMLIAGVVIATLTLPTFINYIQTYTTNFSETTNSNN